MNQSWFAAGLLVGDLVTVLTSARGYWSNPGVFAGVPTRAVLGKPLFHHLTGLDHTFLCTSLTQVALYQRFSLLKAIPVRHI